MNYTAGSASAGVDVSQTVLDKFMVLGELLFKSHWLGNVPSPSIDPIQLSREDSHYVRYERSPLAHIRLIFKHLAVCYELCAYRIGATAGSVR